MAQVLQPVAGGGNGLVGRQWALSQCGQLLRSQMHADAELAGQADVAIEQPLRTLTPAQPHHLMHEGAPARRIHRRCAQLDAGNFLLQRLLHAIQPRGIVLRLRRDQVAIRLAQHPTTGKSAGGIE